MKFGANINSLSVPQWKAYNFDYNDVKSKIKQLTKAKSNSDDDEESDLPYLTAVQTTKKPPVTLKSLRKTFLQNFSNVELFISTKSGELERKLQYFQKVLLKIQAGTSTTSSQNRNNPPNIVDQQIRLNELQFQALELSKVVRDLNRFIIIQKIACNKIFKKFIKYYPETQLAEDMVYELKQELFANPNLLVNIDLTNLTLELTYFLDLATEEQKRLSHENNERRISKNSLFSTQLFLLTSPALLDGPESNRDMNMSQKSYRTVRFYSGARFDLQILFKKNFKIDCLIADNQKLTELLLNMKVLLGFEEWNEGPTQRSNLFLLTVLFKLNFTSNTNNPSATPFRQDLMQFTYLVQRKSKSHLQVEPLFVVTQQNLPLSLVVSQVGGLRKFAYCILPNEVIQNLFDYLLDRKNEEKSKLFQSYFKEYGITPLTKMCIDWILNKNLVPMLKLVCKRSRFLISKEHVDGERPEESEDEELETELVGGVAPNGQPKKLISESSSLNRKYEDDFLLCLDQDILTTNNEQSVRTIKFDSKLDDFNKDNSCLQRLFNDESWDRFPFHHISINLNDLTLSNFKRDMSKNPLTEAVCMDTTIDQPNQRSLKRLPLKIIQLIQLNSVRLFNGDLNFFYYMLLCYYNILPPEAGIHNHYLNLLTLNLLKQNEDVGSLKQANRIHDRLFEMKTRRVLARQLSLKLIKLSSNIASSQLQDTTNSTVNYSYDLTKPNQSNNHNHNHNHGDNYNVHLSGHGYSNYDKQVHVPKQEIEFLKKNMEHHNYGLTNPMDTYGQLRSPEDEGLFAKFVRYFTASKSRLLGYRRSQYDLEHRINSFYDEEEGIGSHVDIERTSLLSLLSSNSQDKLTTLKGKYELQYMSNYDDVLSVIYFSFFCISLFISGIIMGIVYSVIELSTEDSQFFVEDNLALVFIIVIGLLLSLIFSMISINLNLLRFSPGPTWHSVVVWTGAGCVAFSILWSLVLLFM